MDLDLEALRAARARSELVVRADAHALPFAAGTFDTVLANRMLNAAGGIDQVIREMIRVLRPEGCVVILTRARPAADADRLDPENGTQRLAAHFSALTVERAAGAALFVARTPRVR